MARTTLTFNCTKPFDQVDNTIANILVLSGYKKIEQNDEVVWKKGTGFLTAIQYIKIEYGDNTVIASGWIRPGASGILELKEISLEGVAGSIPKKAVKKVLDKIRDAI